MKFWQFRVLKYSFGVIPKPSPSSTRDIIVLSSLHSQRMFSFGR